MENDDPRFPPLLTPTAVSPSTAVLAHACTTAAAGEIGAGDVIWSRARDRAQLAVVLEPEVALRQALQMAPLAMVAMADCLGTLMPPKTAIGFRWPDTVLVNGGSVGRLQVVASTRVLEVVPDWLVVGLALGITPADCSGEPGEHPDVTSLAAEGGGELTRSEIMQSFVAHFLAWLDIWTHEGIAPVLAHWQARSLGPAPRLDDAGNLIVDAHGEACRVEPVDTLDIEGWRKEPHA